MRIRYEERNASPAESVIMETDGDVSAEGAVDRQSSEATAVAETSSPSYMEIDPEFYYECLTFQVENCLFRIPKCLLGAETVKEMLREPLKCGSQIPLEYASDEEGTIPLDELYPEVTKQKFRSFLRVICQRPEARIKDEKAFLTKQQWIFALELAQLWGIQWVQDEAIQILSCLISDPTELVKLGRRHKVRRWCLRGYIALCERQECLTKDECVRLGVDAVVKISRIREKMMAEQAKVEVFGDSEGCSKDETRRAIRKAFKLESVML